MKLIIRTATLIAVIRAWLMLIHKRVVRRNSMGVVTYAPMFPRDKERMANLSYIYNSNDVEAVNMLRIRRGSFAQLVKTLRERQLLQDSIHTFVEE